MHRLARDLFSEGEMMAEDKLMSRAGMALDGGGTSTRNLTRYLPMLAALVLLALSVGFIRETASQVTFSDILGSLQRQPIVTVAGCALFTALSYLILLTYDLMALRASGVRVSPLAAVHTGFIATSMSQTLGFGLATGGGVRMRLYGARGIPASAIIRITIVAGIAFWLGLGAVCSATLLLEPEALSSLTGLSPELTRLAGALLALVLGGYVGGRVLFPDSLKVGRFVIDLPDARTSLLQMALGAADIAVSAAALWVLLPADAAAQTGLVGFAGIYGFLTIAGYVSHVPGGLGILEAGILLAFPNVPAEGLLASILLFRFVYYAVPFALALALFGAAELGHHASRFKGTLGLARAIAISALPTFIATAVFLGGLLLLVSGATPELQGRMHLLGDLVPLPFIEVSHLINSLVGFFLLILSIGLYRRLDAAWAITTVVLCCGIAVSLMKGLDWEEATVLAAVLSLAVMGRKSFYRQSSLLNEEPSVAALTAVGLACAASIAVGFMTFPGVDYSGQLWWQVASSGDAPRFLRASLMMILAAGGVGAYLLLRPTRRAPSESYRIPPQVPTIVTLADRTEPNLALTGDKRFLVAPEGDAFLMYDVQGTSWVVMGDPVGNPQRFADLLWSFREMVDRRGGRAVFYQVRAEHLPRYLDMGLTLLKLGEEAIIDLTRFSLEGGARANLRQSARKAEKQGLTFSVISAADIDRVMDELAEVSEDWLSAKNAEEKQFSVGHFDRTYLSQYDHAVVCHEGRIVAFANIWLSADQAEVSVDLMRFRHDAPKGHMDFLFVQLLLWAKGQGYLRFNLGMAPLSGLEEHPLASAWHKAGNLIFEHAGQIYGFEGLRAFKEKFRPDWHPRYLACQGGLTLPAALLDVMLLVSRPRKRATPPVFVHVPAIARAEELAA